MSDDANARDGIEGLDRHFQQFCSTQPNEGHRLSQAKSHWGQVKYWLQINADKHAERTTGDQSIAEARK